MSTATMGAGARRWPGFGAVFATALLWLAALYYLAVPLFDPRGHAPTDLMIGMPLGVLALAATAVLAAPAGSRRKLAVGLTAVGLMVGVPALALDFAYTMFVLGAWRGDFWLDGAHIPRAYSEPHPELGFVRKPGVSWRGQFFGRDVFYRTDENGFRNPPGLASADIAFVGDSFTEAATVPEQDTFAQVVAAGAGLQAVNLGRGAYGPQQEAIVLEKYALAYQPRFIVWQIFEGNDLTDVYEFLEWTGDPSPRMSLRARYTSNSLFRRFLLKSLEYPGRGAAPATLQHNDGAAEPLFVRYRRESGTGEEAFGVFDELMARAQQVCRERGVELLVIFIPTMVEVLEPYLVFADEGDREAFLQPGIFSSRLREACERAGCDYIDISDALRRAAAEDRRGLYITNDEHLDTRGHEVVAQEVLRWLKSRPSDAGLVSATTRSVAQDRR